MVRLIVRRLAQILPVLLVMSIAVLALTDLLPGDPTIMVLGENATPQQREALRLDMGLDRPAPLRYADWVVRTASGDFGRSLRTREPVSAMMVARLPVTVQLTLFSILVAVEIGVPAGIAALLKHNTAVDLVVSVIEPPLDSWTPSSLILRQGGPDGQSELHRGLQARRSPSDHRTRLPGRGSGRSPGDQQVLALRMEEAVREAGRRT
ncbi:MAG: ABC transporter permease [Burkholderiales bacterium]|nr:ABC transporter permease [Burkholderiales bacterium]